MEVKQYEITCYKCHITFWITDAFDDQLRSCHNTFYCPNGHSFSYQGKTKAEKTKEERDMYKRWYEEEKGIKGRLILSNRALRGVITRQKKKQ